MRYICSTHNYHVNFCISFVSRRATPRPTSFRLPDGIIRGIDADIDEAGEHKTRTEFILDAVRHYINHRKEQRNIEWTRKNSEIVKNKSVEISADIPKDQFIGGIR